MTFFEIFFLGIFLFFFRLIFPIELGHQTKKIEQGKRNRECWVFFFSKFWLFMCLFWIFLLVPQVFKLYGLFNQLGSRHKKERSRTRFIGVVSQGSYCIPKLTLVHWGSQPGFLLYTPADSGSLGWSTRIPIVYPSWLWFIGVVSQGS